MYPSDDKATKMEIIHECSPITFSANDYTPVQRNCGLSFRLVCMYFFLIIVISYECNGTRLDHFARSEQRKVGYVWEDIDDNNRSQAN